MKQTIKQSKNKEYPFTNIDELLHIEAHVKINQGDLFILKDPNEKNQRHVQPSYQTNATYQCTKKLLVAQNNEVQQKWIFLALTKKMWTPLAKEKYNVNA